jgi:hypothetical protein
MAQGESACPKCQHQMQEGFLLDKGGMSAGEWVKGPPEYGWLGLRWFRRVRVLIASIAVRRAVTSKPMQKPSDRRARLEWQFGSTWHIPAVRAS